MRRLPLVESIGGWSEEAATCRINWRVERGGCPDDLRNWSPSRSTTGHSTFRNNLPPLPEMLHLSLEGQRHPLDTSHAHPFAICRRNFMTIPVCIIVIHFSPPSSILPFSLFAFLSFHLHHFPLSLFLECI